MQHTVSCCSVWRLHSTAGCPPSHRCSAGQGIDHLDSLFVGNFLGRQSDIGSGELRDWAFRKFNHLVRHLIQADEPSG